MCIICYKPAGAKFPTKKQFKTMFRHNPDGAGFMTLNAGPGDAGGVLIKKGLMTYSEFRQAFQDTKPDQSRPYIFHFRIATHGGVNEQMTQPFPLTPETRLLKATGALCDVGVAHNGIIPLTTDARKMSDTAEFIRDYMTRITQGGRCFDDITLNIIEACISSRMAILTAAGEVHLLGHGWKKDGGLYFSNDSYIDYYSKPAKKAARKAALYTWNDPGEAEPYSIYDDADGDLYSYCDGYCSACKFLEPCWGTGAGGADIGINSL